MPLTKKGKKILATMQQAYGKEKGTHIFYAYTQKHPTSEIHIDNTEHTKRKKLKE